MRRLLVAPIALVAVACGSAATPPQPNAVTWTPPPDWLTVSNAEGSIQLTLPPWLQVFDNHGAIFANEPPVVPGATFISLWAQGPAGIENQPLEGEDLAAWTTRRLENPAEGVPTVTRVALPAGAGIRYDRIDSDDGGYRWRIVVFAIQTPRGAAWLQLDGPPERWAARADDLERVAFLFRIR